MVRVATSGAPGSTRTRKVHRGPRCAIAQNFSAFAQPNNTRPATTQLRASGPPTAASIPISTNAPGYASRIHLITSSERLDGAFGAERLLVEPRKLQLDQHQEQDGGDDQGGDGEGGALDVPECQVLSAEC